MTKAQEITIRNIIAESKKLHDSDSKKITIDGQVISMSKVTPEIRPYYKEIGKGKILFGLGTGAIVSDSYVVEIKGFRIINSNGEIINKNDYSNQEIELTEKDIEISMINKRDDMILLDYLIL